MPLNIYYQAQILYTKEVRISCLNPGQALLSGTYFQGNYFRTLMTLMIPANDPRSPKMSKRKILFLTAVISILCSFTSYAFDSIRRGDRGEHVIEVQQMLIDLGYLSGRADGVFGGMTEAAVLAFQEANALDVTGIIGEATYNSLLQKSADASTGMKLDGGPAQGEDSTPQETPAPQPETTAQETPAAQQGSTSQGASTQQQDSASQGASSQQQEAPVSETQPSASSAVTPAASSASTEIIESAYDLKITEAGYSISDGYLYYSFALKNNGDGGYACPMIRMTARNADGKVIGIYDQIMEEVYPSEELWWAGKGCEMKEEPAKVEFSLLLSDFNIVTSSMMSHDGFYYPTINSDYTMANKVQSFSTLGYLFNPNDFPLKAAVVVIYRDENGSMIGGDHTVTDWIDPEGQVFYDFKPSFIPIEYAFYEIYAMPVSLRQ